MRTWRRFTPEELARLRAEYPTCASVRDLAASMARSYHVLLRMAHIHGIKRDPDVAQAARLRGVAAGVRARLAKQPTPEQRAMRATDLDRAWRGLE